ncbi:unnamed protein product [Durusdinium trenchii]|uniref:Uncharacterized protein n=1 Tax=Durusdinium trenchii TaxID=1381693 RepID=A0ABP0INU2_9DINO
MPWKKWQGQGKGQQWSEWEKPSKKGKDKEEKGGKQPILYGWDGKKIEVKRDGGAKPGSSSGSSHSDAALREENRKIKEVVRNLLGSETQSDADIQALRDFAKVIDEQEANFQSWQETYKAGLEQEEKRYQAKMAELREELKGLPVYVQQELADLRGQMRQFMSYAQMMEKKNAALTDQVTMLVTTLQSREQQISSDFSPQHPVPRSGNGNTLWAPSKEEGVASVEKRERSRSPTRKIAKLEHKLDPVEFKLQLEKISEGSGGGAAPDPEADAKKGLNVPHPLPEAGSSALAPFGKKTKPGAAERQNVSPYGRVRTKEMDGSCVLEGLDS